MAPIATKARRGSRIDQDVGPRTILEQSDDTQSRCDQPTPASAPASFPTRRGFRVGKNMARFADMTSARMNEPPKARALLKPATCSSLNPFTRIQTLPNNTGEYQRPPMTNVERAAAKCTLLGFSSSRQSECIDRPASSYSCRDCKDYRPPIDCGTAIPLRAQARQHRLNLGEELCSVLRGVPVPKVSATWPPV